MCEPLTVDLDPDEPRWLDRIIAIQERLLQSDFIGTDEARSDIEVLIENLKSCKAK